MGANREDIVNELIAKEEIREALLRFCRGVDRDDQPLLGSVYHPDAVDVHGDTFSGSTLAADLLNFVTRIGSPMWQHQVSNITIELVGTDRALCESYFNVYYVLSHEGNQFLARAIGRYLDRMEKRDGEWRIASRQTVGDLGWAQPLDQSMLALGNTPPPDESMLGKRDRTDPSYVWFART